MTGRRFVVVSVTGHSINARVGGHSGGGGSKVRTSFAVLDRGVCSRTVAEFNAGRGRGGSMSQEKREALAHAFADRLEAECAEDAA